VWRATLKTTVSSRYPLYTCRESSTNQPLFCKTNPICKNAKQTETYVHKGLMKQLPRATVEKTKPICKNAKMNLNLCTEMTYEGKCPLRPTQKQTQSKPIKPEAQRRSLRFGLWLGGLLFFPPLSAPNDYRFTQSVPTFTQVCVFFLIVRLFLPQNVPTFLNLIKLLHRFQIPYIAHLTHFQPSGQAFFVGGLKIM
jgi:hypothetical protein